MNIDELLINVQNLNSVFDRLNVVRLNIVPSTWRSFVPQDDIFILISHPEQREGSQERSRYTLSLRFKYR